MEYRTSINHPEYGEMLSLTESAKYLGISGRKFQRMELPPDYVQEGYPFWSKRVLDILPVNEDFNLEEVRKRGKTCGCYLIGTMEELEIRELRKAITGASLGGRVRNHTCGIEENTQGFTSLERARGMMWHCDCRGTTPEEETSYVLQQHGIRMTFRSWLEAQEFRNGILSAIKAYVTRKLSGMERGDACKYIMGVWGGGSYQGLLVRLKPHS